jgi:transcriptional regulator GlxA family with amidase domain
MTLIGNQVECQIPLQSPVFPPVLDRTGFDGTHVVFRAGMNCGDDMRVRQVVRLMDEHRAAPLSVEQLARAVNLSPSQLTRLFREHTGSAPARFARELRLRHAYELIQTSFLSIKEVMAAVGWSDPSHFCRDFKRKYGVSPKGLRRRDDSEYAAVADL